MGRSRFLHGNDLTVNVTPVASTVAPSSADPVVQPITQGSATLNTHGDFAGSESDVWTVQVISEDATGADSEITQPQFTGQGDVSRDSDLQVVRETDSAPSGNYELICDSEGSQDTIAAMVITDGYVYSANIGDESLNYTAYSLSGESGNRITLRCYAVMNDNIFDGAKAATLYPRPGGQLLRISPISSAPFSEAVSMAGRSESSILPAIFGSAAWLGEYSGRSIVVPSINSSGDYNGFFLALNSEGRFSPQANDARFVVGFPANSEATDLSAYLQVAFLDRVFKEFTSASSDGTPVFQHINTPREGSLIPKGFVSYPVVGGYLIHIFLSDINGDHLADFYYTHFPFVDSNGVHWFPITTWGELSWALHMHRQMGWYYSYNTENQVPQASDLRYPILKWGASSVPDLRHKNVSNIANQEINIRTDGTVGFPIFSGGISKFDAFRILDRTAINVMDGGDRVSKSVIEGVFDRVTEEGMSVFLVSIVNDRTQQRVELAPLESYREILLSAGIPEDLIPLDFRLPLPVAPQTTEITNIVVVNGQQGRNYVVTLKGDTPDNPRTTKICVHHIHVGSGLKRNLSVILVYTKFVAEQCQPCDDYVPDDYNGACIDAIDDEETEDTEIENSVSIFGNTILTPIPTAVHNQGVASGLKGSSFSEWYGKAWGSAFLYLRKTDFNAGVDLNAYISALDVIQSTFEDMLFRLEIVDRSTVSTAQRNDPASPDFSILLGAMEAIGDVSEPENQIDPFCATLTSGCCPGFGGIVFPSEDGKEFTAGGTNVYPNLAMGGNTSRVFETLASAQRTYGYSLSDTPLKLTAGDNHGLSWLDDPVPNEEWFYQVAEQCVETQFDVALSHFRTRFLPFFSSAFPTGVTPASIAAEAAILAADRDLWKTDPYEYIETVYSSHASYDPIFSWLYSLPTTRSERVAHTDSMHNDAASNRITWLRENSTQQAFCVGEASATSRVLVFTVKLVTPSFTHQGLMSELPYPTTTVFTEPEKTEYKQLIASFSYEKSWTECRAALYDMATEYSATPVLVENLGYYNPDPSTIYITMTVMGVNRQWVSQNPNVGVTAKQHAVITGYLQSQFPTAPHPESWEILHFGSQMPVNKLPSAGGKSLSTWNGSHGTVFAPGTTDTGWNSYRTMEQIFWLRLLKLIAKTGYSWDYEKFLLTCPPVENMTNNVGCPDESGSGCTNFFANTDFWKVNVEGDVLPPAFTNHTYYDLEQRRFSFLVACRCPEDIEYGDQITIHLVAPALDKDAIYKKGDGFVIPLYAAGKLVSGGGQDDRDIALWRFRFPPTSGLSDVLLTGIPNYAGHGWYDITADRLSNYFRLSLSLGLDYFKKGDKFAWSVSGGRYLVRSELLGVSSPLYLSSEQVDPFPLSSQGVKLSFTFNKGVPFKLGDTWRILFRQNHAASHVTRWSVNSWWQSNGVNPAGETLVFNFGTGNSKSINALSIVGHNLTPSQRVYLEGKNVVDIAWTDVVGTNIPVYAAMRYGYPIPPVTHLFSVPTTAYEMWRIRVTDPTTLLSGIVITKVILATVGYGDIQLDWDHASIMSCELKFNANALGSSSSLIAPFIEFTEDIDIEYTELLLGPDFDRLMELIHTTRGLSGSPFVWIPNSSRIDRARVCRLRSSSFKYVHRDAEFITDDTQKAYSNLVLPVRVIDPNKGAE